MGLVQEFPCMDHVSEVYPTTLALFHSYFYKSFISNFQLKYRVNQRNYILYSEQFRKAIVQTHCYIFREIGLLVVIFVSADELGALQWLLSLCLFSFFSQTLS